MDLPFAGNQAQASTEAWNALQLYLDSVKGRAGDYAVTLKKYDNATATCSNRWDEATCTGNANAHVANADEVAVIGTYNVGCSKLEIPVLNRDPSGPMLIVSGRETEPRFTKPWDEGEPNLYYPTGARNYARTITTDDVQGAAAAQLAAAAPKASKCFVLTDNFTYGKKVAAAFVAAAPKMGVTVVGQAVWHGADKSYTTLFNQAKAAGADCVYFGGVFDVNGAQLTKDKVAVLGDNTKVKLIAPAGFAGYPEFVSLPEAAGAYLTFVGRWDGKLATYPASSTLVSAYQAKYSSEPSSI